MSSLAALFCLAESVSAGVQALVPAQDAPTPVEQALMEHQCSAIRAARPGDIASYDTCLNTQLLSMRADFGRDLGRLSPAERRTIDAACNKIRTAEGRDAYVACLSRQLVTLRSRRGVAAPVEPSAVTTAPPPAASPASAVQPPSPNRRSSSLTFVVTGAAVLIAGAAGAWLVMKRRRPSAVCRACGASVPGGGDLCQRCRHQAADAQRRAAIERAQSERGQSEHAQGELAQSELAHENTQIGQYDVEGGQVGHAGQASRLEQLGQMSRVNRAGEIEQVRRVGPVEPSAAWRDDELRRSYEMAEPSEFDPHVILGLLPTASREAIEAAYQEARARYDAEQVAHLGPEAREHFRMKAEAVERAYRMLAGGDNASQESLV